MTLLIQFLLSLSTALACSTFLMDGDRKIVGKNFDWDDGTAMVVVNPRNLEKTALTLARADAPATWKARYSSITFNQYGRELPYGGMNEAGLAVEIMWLTDSSYPGGGQNALPAVNQPQWIQFILDTSGTVNEAVQKAKTVRVSPHLGASVHYLVCDRGGECAAFEYLDKKLVITRNAGNLSIKALTNSTASSSLADLASRSGFGGRREIPETGYNSLDRFSILHYFAAQAAEAGAAS